MICDLSEFSVSYQTLHRLHRVGACPVLEVIVNYPVLGSGAGGEERPAVARFNRTYRSISENILAWAEGVPAQAAVDAFHRAGVNAVYRFDRRVLACEMMVSYPPEGDEGVLTVTRTLRAFSRRGDEEERVITATDDWIWPELTLEPPRRKRRKKPTAQPPAVGGGV